MQVRAIALAGVLAAAPGFLQAQFDFHVAGRELQVRGLRLVQT